MLILTTSNQIIESIVPSVTGVGISAVIIFPNDIADQELKKQTVDCIQSTIFTHLENLNINLQNQLQDGLRHFIKSFSRHQSRDSGISKPNVCSQCNQELKHKNRESDFRGKINKVANELNILLMEARKFGLDPNVYVHVDQKMLGKNTVVMAELYDQS